MEEFEPLFEFHLFGLQIGITSTIITQWVLVLLISIVAISVTRSLKKIPDKRQSAVEIVVDGISGLVRDNMGDHYMGFVPYVGALMIYLLAMNLSGLVGATPPTEDLSVTMGMASITFFVIQGYTIKKIGIVHYFMGFGKPILPLLPINILERIMLPISLSLRLFGNLTAAAVVMKLGYEALTGISPVLGLIIPIPLHIYFDLFDGVVQMIIFVMLTIINIKIISEH